MTRLISVSSVGTAAGLATVTIGTGFSTASYLVPTTMSADGRWFAFASDANDVVADSVDLNQSPDAFLRDARSGSSILASVDLTGHAAGVQLAVPYDFGALLLGPKLSAAAETLVFESSADTLAAGSPNRAIDVFARDLARGMTVLASVTAPGRAAGNGRSGMPVSSADGRFIAFTSNATNLTTADVDHSGTWDVFLRDMDTGTTQLVSVTPSGVSGNGHSVSPSISADGYTVAFLGYATDLTTTVVDHDPAIPDVYVRDLAAGATTLVSVDSSGHAASGSGAAISADGRYVAYVGDGVYVRDLVALTTTVVSITPDGAPCYGGSPRISADGRTVAFASPADTLVTGGRDGNHTDDIYVRHLATATTTLVSADGRGQAMGGTDAALSPDGRYVASVPASDGFAYVRDLAASRERCLALPHGRCSLGVSAAGSSRPRQRSVRTVHT